MPSHNPLRNVVPAVVASVATLHAVAADTSSAHEWVDTGVIYRTRTSAGLGFRFDPHHLLSVDTFALAATTPATAPLEQIADGEDSAPAVPDGDASSATTTNEELAMKLANPVADLVSLPFQFNYQRGIGPEDDGTRYLLNVQPVIPFNLNDDWLVISRTIVPVVHQDDIFPGAGSQTGLGDIVQSFFFSPAQPVDGWVLGAGPVLLLPTATDDLLGLEQWGAGPTGVALRQDGPWTYGALVNHIWSFEGPAGRADVNATFLQPFVAYTTKDAWTFTLQTESTYNWESSEWDVPIALIASKVTMIGDQPVSIGAGVRYWAESSSGGPEGIGFRINFTLLFPK
jgi:hypothetical protein